MDSITRGNQIMTPEEIHAILVTEAEKRSLPECYKNDLLVHDLNWLHDYGSQNFIWILRTCGTFCFPLDCMDDNANCKLRMIDGLYKLRHNWPDSLLKNEYGGGDKEVYYYHFVNGRLTPVTHEQAHAQAKDVVAAHLRNLGRHREIAALQQSME